MTQFLEAGDGHKIEEGCMLGVKHREECQPVRLGKDARIRSGTIIYGDVQAGDDFQTGHNVVVREWTTMGDHVAIGTNSVIDGNVQIGNFVKIMTNCYIPTHTVIGNRVFLGPNVTLTNDRYPLKMRDIYSPEGPIIEDYVTLSAGVVVCPGVRVGRNSFVAAGAVVTRDVPPESMAIGVPARFAPLRDDLRQLNVALSWRRFLNE